MPYRIAGIDVHKKMLAVVVADVEIDGDFHFDRQKVGTTPADLRHLADWLIEQDVEEVVMESTARSWRPVWEALEQHWRLPAPCARECAAARGHQITRNRVQLHYRLEALLEEAHIKVSSIVSDLLGISARRMLQALAEGRRVLNQAANAAVKAKGTIFALVYRRIVPRLRTRAGDRGHHSPAMSIDLEDPARARTVRGTRAGGQRRGEEGKSAQDDPRTAKSRLQRRTFPGSLEQSGMIGSDFRPWLIREAA